jgi:hypothetical protein
MTYTVYKAVSDLLKTGEQAARTTLVAAQSFVPMPRNSTMLVTPAGHRLVPGNLTRALAVSTWTPSFRHRLKHKPGRS